MAPAPAAAAEEAKEKDLEYEFTRIFHAPRARVFEAWTDPERLARWFGPNGFTSPVCEIDARAGGAYRIVIRSPEGTEYPLEGVFREFVRPERLVMTMDASEHPAEWHADLRKHGGVGSKHPDALVVTVTFDDEGAATRLRVRSRFLEKADRDAHLKMGTSEGWSQSFDRLAALLGARMETPTHAAGARAALEGDRDIAITRTFDAPRELVFEAFTDPRHVAQWWGPKGFTTTTSEMDVRPGGVWRFVMHGPDGRDYPNKIVYVEVVRPERLVYRHAGEAGTEPVNFQVSIVFEKAGAGTRVSWRMTFPSAKAREFVVTTYGAVDGLTETVGRLAEYLSRGASGAKEFVVTRDFDAPRELVWKAWTENERLREWWGPKGFTMLSCTNDLRPGGAFHYGMKAPDGSTMWGKWVYREVAPPERLVFLSSFSNEKGEVTRAPFSGDWPLEVLSTLTLSERGGRTTAALSGVAHRATEAERRMFESFFGSMQQGWAGTLDQLGEFLVRSR